MSKRQGLSLRDSDRLYDQYVRPLEVNHRGQYTGVSLQGGVVLAPTLVEVVQKAVSQFGKNNSVAFRVGPRAVGRV
jgi:hypothetical protein